MFEITDKIAVVVGASSGLGADAAIAYADAGAKVALLARRKAKLDHVVKEIQDKGHEAIAVTCDVTDEENVKKAIEEVVSHYGKIDILLNNAGVAVSGGVTDLKREDWDWALATNLTGQYLVCKYVIPHMLEQNYGKIVNVASVNAKVADKDDVFIRHSYNASKAGVLGLTEGMAASYARYNITVNAVGPGLFESEMTEDTLMKSEEFLKGYNHLTPASRPGNRGELNGTILYLSSDASSYVTGQNIYVDGGFAIV